MTYEVGSGQVPIVPILKGFRRPVIAEVDATTAEAGQRFQRGFRRTGDDSGRETGTAFRNGFSSTTTGLTGDVQKEVAAAARAVSTARLREQDAAGKVRIAETQLAEARGKYAADSSQVVRAEERLASSQRTLAEQQTTTAAATARLTAAQTALAASTAAAGSATAAATGGFRGVLTNVTGLFAPVSLLSRGLGELASRGMRPVLGLLGQVGNSVARVVTPAFRALGGQMVAVVRPITTAMSNVATVVRTGVTSAFTTAAGAVTRTLAPALQRLAPLGGAIGTAIRSGMSLAGSALSAIGGVASTVAGGLAEVFGHAMAGIKQVVGDTANFVGSAFKNAAIAVSLALSAALVKVGFASFSAAARVQELDVAMQAVGKSTGVGYDVISQTARAVKAQGIEMASAQSLAIQFAQANLDMASASKIARVAQDLAVISGKNSTETTDTLVQAIITQHTVLLRSVGITKSAEEGYQAYAAKIGTTADKLTDLQKKQALVDLILEEGTKVAGAYEAAMTSPGKVLRSFPRLLNDIAVSLGGPLLDAFGPAIVSVYNLVRGFDAGLEEGGKFYPILQLIGDKVTAITAPIRDGAARLADWVTNLQAGESVISSVKSVLDNLGGTLAIFAPLIGLAFGSLGPLLARIPLLGRAFVGLTGPVGLVLGLLGSLLLVKPATLTSAFEALIPAIGDFATKILSGLTGFIQRVIPGLVANLAANAPILFQGAADLVLGVVNAIVAGLPQLLASIVAIIPSLVTALLGMVPALMDAGLQLLLGLVNAVVLATPMVVAAVVDLLPGLLTAIVGMLPKFIDSGLALFLGLVSAVVKAVPQIVTALVAALPTILRALVAAIPRVVAAGIQLFLGLVGALTTIIPQLIQAVTDLLPVIIDAIVDMIPILLEAAVDLFVQLVEALPVVIPQLITAIIGMLPQIITALVGMIPKLIDGAVKLFMGIVKALPVIIPKLVEAIIGIGPQIVQALIDMVPDLFNAGKALIKGLIDGVLASFGAIGNAFHQVMDFIGGFFPHSPAKRGPFSGAGWARVADSGSSLVHQFAAGAERARVAVPLSAAFGDLSRISQTLNVGLQGRSGTSQRGQVIEHMEVHPPPGVDTVTLAREIMREARWMA